MTATFLFAGIPVTDYPAARAWYERLFGREPDMLPHDTEATWQVTEQGWVYVVADPERAGRGLTTILVDDLDAEVAALAARGLETDPIDTIPGKVRTAAITDHDGNRITFGQPLVSRADVSARIRTARWPAFLGLSRPTQATGTPGGICATDSSASSPPAAVMPLVSGTPITGRSVCAATTPGSAADRPAPAMITFSPRERAFLRRRRPCRGRGAPTSR